MRDSAIDVAYSDLVVCFPIGDGEFELVSPPSPVLSRTEELADALLESVEMAREQGFNDDES